MDDAGRLPRPARSAPKAKAEQLDVQQFEDGLLARARELRPAVSWWHGYRKVGTLYGSYCYVCDTVISTWPPLGNIPKAARQAIHEHKFHHAAGN